MDSDHYTIPGYQDCVEQAAERVRREIHALQALHRGATERSRAAGLSPERLQSMLAWRRSLLLALTPDSCRG